ncbi:MAG: hypothetical protein ACREJM_08850, partial [Candidatus Saccharimonadales bacterium]
VLNGGSSNDLLTNTGGTSITLFGGSGNDTLSTSGGTQVELTGEAGDNTYVLGGSGDSTQPASVTLDDVDTFGATQSQTDGQSPGINTIEFAGEQGVRLDLSQASTGDASSDPPVQMVAGDLNVSLIGPFQNVYGTPGNDYLHGNASANLLVAGGGNDTLVSGSGPATLVAGSGNDSLVSGSGGTTFRFSGNQFGSDVIDPPAPTSNTLDFSQYGGPVSLNLASTATQTVTPNAVGATNSTGLTLTLASATAVNGLIDSNYADAIIGNALNDRFIVGPGGDTFTGGGGADSYFFTGANLGNVTINEGGAYNGVTAGSNNTLNFLGFTSSGVKVDLSKSAGTQTVANGLTLAMPNFEAFSTVIGTPYSDTLLAGGGNSTLIGAGGDDSLVAGPGNDMVQGNVTQVVYLDFSQELPGEYIYQPADQQAILARLQHD